MSALRFHCALCGHAERVELPEDPSPEYAAAHRAVAERWGHLEVRANYAYRTGRMIGGTVCQPCISGLLTELIGRAARAPTAGPATRNTL